MVTSIVWPVISSVLSTLITGGVIGVYRAIRKQHERFDKLDQHLREQDLRIARIEGKVGT